VVVRAVVDDLLGDAFPGLVPGFVGEDRDETRPRPEGVLSGGRLGRVGGGRNRDAAEWQRIWVLVRREGLPAGGVLLERVPVQQRVTEVDAVAAPSLVALEPEVLAAGDVELQRGRFGERRRDPVGARLEV